uniref:Uncharacterized protein n=1 Tax=Arundo donax TaxID=35708 RepID=A0A0A9BQJ2_ARUDO
MLAASRSLSRADSAVIVVEIVAMEQHCFTVCSRSASPHPARTLVSASGQHGSNPSKARRIPPDPTLAASRVAVSASAARVASFSPSRNVIYSTPHPLNAEPAVRTQHRHLLRRRPRRWLPLWHADASSSEGES